MMQRVEFTPGIQYHLLRHFRQIDQTYRENLKDHLGFSDGQINDQLSMTGSKFYPDFAKNPAELWKKIQEHPNFYFPTDNDWNEKRFEISLNFSQKIFPEGIGSDSLIKLNNMLIEERAILQKKDRDGYLINMVQLNRTISTWQVNVILWKDEQLRIKTIFPGIYAPPFPNLGYQSKEEFHKNKHFWESHAFITS